MTTNRLAIAAAAICAAFQAQSSLAMPMAPMATMTIEGTIRTISWHPEKLVKGLPGMSGSAGSDRTVPAHYRLTLTDTKVTSTQAGIVPFTSGKDVDTTLNHPKDDGFLKQGMKVRIINFRMSGDEGGVRTSFQKIEILGKNEAAAAATGADEPAKVYAGFEALAADAKVSPSNPARNATVLGQVAAEGKPFRFSPLTPGSLGVMFITPKTEQLQEEVTRAAEKAGGAVAVLATGDLTMKPQAAPPPARPDVVTGVYRGPFYQFEINGCKVLSPDEAEALARKIGQTEHIRGFLRQISPLAFGEVKVRITMLDVHPQNPYQKTLTSGVVVGVRIDNPTGKVFALDVPAATVKVGNKTLTATPRPLRGGYLSGPAVSKPGDRGGQFSRWSLALSEMVEGGEDATVTLTFKAGDISKTYTESLKISSYRNPPEIPGRNQTAPATGNAARPTAPKPGDFAEFIRVKSDGKHADAKLPI